MVGVESIIDKMKRQPNGIKYNEAARVLKEYGYQLVRKKSFKSCLYKRYS
ncbi:hypothetical protein [Desulfitibacter alkalitolerans]|nr:hypothetical protein [Desulfitibacter alkalitolerans]